MIRPSGSRTNKANPVRNGIQVQFSVSSPPAVFCLAGTPAHWLAVPVQHITAVAGGQVIAVLRSYLEGAVPSCACLPLLVPRFGLIAKRLA